MQAIILAAGQGTRLAPLTNDRPKCMVEIAGIPIVDRLIDTIQQAGISRISVVGGYMANTLQNHLKEKGVAFYTNKEFDKTNMVYTLFQAPWGEEDTVISYGDIIYREALLKALMASPAKVATVVDKEWRSLWELRMEDPLKDAETMKIDSSGHITELGREPQSLDEIQGQYIGLTKFSSSFCKTITNYWHSLDTKTHYEGKSKENMFMTTFLQLIINNISPITAVPVEGGWVEIDTVDDFRLYQNSEVLAKRGL